jgi:nucleoside-diphosphate-sugar epimerase
MSQLAQKRILITGASGFLGSNIAQKLCELGAEVHAVSRRPQESKNLLNWRRADLCDPQIVRTVIASVRPDLIIHLASEGVGSPVLEHVLPTFNNDLACSVNILTAAAELRTERILIARSLEEPDDHPDEIPGSPYAAAKWATSTYAKMFHRLYGTPIVMVRPFMTYGPGQRADKLIPYTILSFLRGDIPSLGSGQRLVDWVYVDDVTDGILAACCIPDIEGCTFDLGSGNLVSIRSVICKIAELVHADGSPIFGAIAERPVEKVRAANSTSARNILGWSARTTLEDGLLKTIEWFSAQAAQHANGPPGRRTATTNKRGLDVSEVSHVSNRS